jgi:hypothetical protein
MEVAAFMVLLALVVMWISAPLRRPIPDAGEPRDLGALEAERDSRLAAVRDAELDRATGKLSDDDHRALDAQLRSEALAALRDLDEGRAEPPGR